MEQFAVTIRSGYTAERHHGFASCYRLIPMVRVLQWVWLAEMFLSFFPLKDHMDDIDTKMTRFYSLITLGLNTGLLCQIDRS